MTCAKCGKTLSKYNPMKLCYACDDLVDDWDEAIRLPDDNVWESYPPPQDGESLTHYFRRLLTKNAGSIPIYQVASHYGYKRREVDSAVGAVKRWFKRRGCMVVNDARGCGYRVVRCPM